MLDASRARLVQAAVSLSGVHLHHPGLRGVEHSASLVNRVINDEDQMAPAFVRGFCLGGFCALVFAAGVSAAYLLTQ
jgi:hypothetical protein